MPLHDLYMVPCSSVLNCEQNDVHIAYGSFGLPRWFWELRGDVSCGAIWAKETWGDKGREGGVKNGKMGRRLLWMVPYHNFLKFSAVYNLNLTYISLEGRFFSKGIKRKSGWKMGKSSHFENPFKKKPPLMFHLAQMTKFKITWRNFKKKWAFLPCFSSIVPLNKEEKVDEKSEKQTLSRKSYLYYAHHLLVVQAGLRGLQISKDSRKELFI